MTAARRAGLCLFLARAELSRRYAGTRLGIAWSLILPLASVLATWIALDLILRGDRAAAPGYGFALAVGFAPWLFLSDAISASLSSVTGQPHLVKKTVFPVGLLPASAVLASAAAHLAVVAVLVLLFLLLGRRPSASLLTLPLWMAAAFALALAAGAAAAALNVLAPDTGAMVPALLSIWFWLSPVVWPLSLVAEGWRALAYLNPATAIIEGYRYAILGASFADPALAAASLLGIGAAGALSLLLFSRARPLFADAL